MEFDNMVDLDCHTSQYLMEKGMRNKAYQVLAQCLTQHQRQFFGSLEAVCSGGPAPALILCCPCCDTLHLEIMDLTYSLGADPYKL